jgi:hypothetical protein
MKTAAGEPSAGRRDGWNPLAALDPNSPRVFEEAAELAQALINGDSASGSSARDLMAALMIWKVRRERS